MRFKADKMGKKRFKADKMGKKRFKADKMERSETVLISEGRSETELISEGRSETELINQGRSETELISEGKRQDKGEQDRMGENSVIFKGNTEGLAIIIPETHTAEQAMTEVKEKIQGAARFFKGAHLKVTYRGIFLSADEQAQLLQILDGNSGAIIESLNCAVETDAASLADRPAAARQSVVQPLRRIFTRGQDECDCKFVRNTLRGGTRIQYEGSVVVVGDVNPGAEVIAAGNVIVLGLLRGMVHAGSGGSRDAFIAALKLKPTQLRIADLIARSPDDPDRSGVFPEIASVRDGIIEVNPLYERI